jgi:hypothetical protein
MQVQGADFKPGQRHVSPPLLHGADMLFTGWGIGFTTGGKMSLLNPSRCGHAVPLIPQPKTRVSSSSAGMLFTGWGLGFWVWGFPGLGVGFKVRGSQFLGHRSGGVGLRVLGVSRRSGGVGLGYWVLA